MSENETDCEKYARHIADTLFEIYEGTTKEENCDGEKYSLYDYVSDALDIEFRVDIHKEYRSAEIMVTYGGPNCYIDTGTHMVHCYWGGDEAHIPASIEATDAIDDIAREMWEGM